jgi:hypothetical protein
MDRDAAGHGPDLMAVSTGTTMRAVPIDLRSHAVATGLIAYGLIGLILAAVLLAALGPADLGGLGRIDAERQAVVDLIASTEKTALDSRSAVDRATGSIDAGADAADESAGFARQLASALRQLASALRVDLFGSRPFESAAGDVEGAADRAEAAAGGLDRAASQARSGAEGMSALSADLQTASVELGAVRAGLEATSSLGTSLTWLRITLMGLVLWLAVPAVVSLWLGTRLRRASTESHAHR